MFKSFDMNCILDKMEHDEQADYLNGHEVD